jgi:hypothetical protein
MLFGLKIDISTLEIDISILKTEFSIMKIKIFSSIFKIALKIDI